MATVFPIAVLGKEDGTPYDLAQTDIVHVPSKASFARPGDTTAYAINDLIANSATAGSVAALSFTGATLSGNGGEGTITGFGLHFSAGAAGVVRAHFLKTNHAVSNGDNGAFILTSLDLDNYLGHVDVSVDGGSGAFQGFSQCAVDYQLATGDTIYVLLEARSAMASGNAATITAKPRFRRYS